MCVWQAPGQAGCGLSTPNLRLRLVVDADAAGLSQRNLSPLRVGEKVSRRSLMPHVVAALLVVITGVSVGAGRRIIGPEHEEKPVRAKTRSVEDHGGQV